MITNAGFTFVAFNVDPATAGLVVVGCRYLAFGQRQVCHLTGVALGRLDRQRVAVRVAVSRLLGSFCVARVDEPHKSAVRGLLRAPGFMRVFAHAHISGNGQDLRVFDEDALGVAGGCCTATCRGLSVASPLGCQCLQLLSALT